MRLLIALPIALSISFVSLKEARANIQVAGDFNLGVPLSDKATMETGIGFGARVGYDLSFGPVFVTPEASGGYLTLGAEITRVMGGMRIGFGKFLVPSVFAHFGYGWVGASYESLGQLYETKEDGFAWDAGFTLLIRPFEAFAFGPHISYNRVDGADPKVGGDNHWLNFGAGAGIFF